MLLSLCYCPGQAWSPLHQLIAQAFDAGLARPRYTHGGVNGFGLIKALRALDDESTREPRFPMADAVIHIARPVLAPQLRQRLIQQRLNASNVSFCVPVPVSIAPYHSPLSSCPRLSNLEIWIYRYHSTWGELCRENQFIEWKTMKR